jgi:uncharacterized protein YegP (UPF0339 family)
MKRAKFEVFQDSAGQYRWRLKARNGKVVAVGESYTRESSAKRSLMAVYTAARNAFSDECPAPSSP